jgi:hypothetical protein
MGREPKSSMQNEDFETKDGFLVVRIGFLNGIY